MTCLSSLGAKCPSEAGAFLSLGFIPKALGLGQELAEPSGLYAAFTDFRPPVRAPWRCLEAFEGHAHYVMMCQWNPKAKPFAELRWHDDLPQ